VKIYHKAKMINDKGGVSPVCAEKPRAIDLTRATWTNRWEAVTCKKCLAKHALEGKS
jgi:hypothetical protein